MNKLAAPWRGDPGLADAFWTCAVFGGRLVDIATGGGFPVPVTRDRRLPALLICDRASLACRAAALVRGRE